jgi:hypothetical protein
MLSGDEASLPIHHNAEYLLSPADGVEHLCRIKETQIKMQGSNCRELKNDCSRI